MSARVLHFKLPEACWILEISDSAWQVLDRHAQRRRGMKESVGQLFTKDLTSARVVVDVATVLSPTSSAWTKVQFNTKAAMAEREMMFEMGLHCIGLWHTHPEPEPQPSSEDKVLAREHALAAKPQLSGLVFAIVGNSAMPSALRVWVDDGTQLLAAARVCSTTISPPSPISR